MRRHRIPLAACGASLLFLGGTLCVAAVPENAQQPQSEPYVKPQWLLGEDALELRAGAARSDNVTKSNVDPKSETIASVGMGLDYDRDGPRLDVRAVADIDRLEYLDDTYDPTTFGYFDGVADVGLVQDSFIWTFRETYGQLVLDPLRADTPDNLENLNYFSTGPRVQFHLGAATRLTLQGSYSIVDYEELNADNDQVLGGAELARLLSDTSSVSVNATATRVDFDDTTARENYDLQAAFVRYSVHGFRTSLDADVGYSQVKAGDESSGGMLVRLEGSRRISPSASFFMRVRKQFSNAGNLFRDGLAGGNPTSPGLDVSSSDAFEENGGGIGVNFDRDRTQLGLGVDWSEEGHETQTALDREVLAVDGYVMRRLRPALTLQLDARYDSEKFENSDFDDERLRAGASLEWQLGRVLAVRLHYDYAQRTASDPAGEYDENRYGITFLYKPRGD